MEGRYFGRIWFPNLETQPIESVWLTITQKSMYVEIPASIFQDDSWPIVLGEFSGGSLGTVTMLKASLSGGLGGTGGSYRKLVFHHLLKGVHISEYANLRFSRMVLQSPALLNWLGYYHGVERSDDGKTFTIPEKMNVFESSVGDIKLTFRLGYGYTTGNHETQIKHYCNAFIEFREERHMDEFMKQMYLLKKFILFVTNSDPNFSDIGLSRKGDEYIKWNIIFPAVDSNNFSANIQPHYLLLKDHLQPLLKLWFESEKFQDVIELLLEHYFNTRLSWPRVYQNMCVAIETYHQNHVNPKMPKPAVLVEHRKHILSFLEDGSEIKKWFSEVSSHLVKPQLIDRLKMFKETLDRLLSDTIDCDIDDLLDKIKQARNEITHLGMPYKRFNRFELILVAKAMEFTIKSSILELTGVPVDMAHNSLIDEGATTILHLARGNNYFDESDRLRR